MTEVPKVAVLWKRNERFKKSWFSLSLQGGHYNYSSLFPQTCNPIFTTCDMYPIIESNLNSREAESLTMYNYKWSLKDACLYTSESVCDWLSKPRQKHTICENKYPTWAKVWKYRIFHSLRPFSMTKIFTRKPLLSSHCIWMLMNVQNECRESSILGTDRSKAAAP